MYGTDYCTSEQYFQCSKTLDSKDYVAAAQIMNTADHVTMKDVENNISVSSDWSDQIPVIMEIGVRVKLSQNPELAAIVLETGTRHIQECNRYDSYWGSGLSLTAATACDDYIQLKGKKGDGQYSESCQRLPNRTLMSLNFAIHITEVM